jgi:hypothetical protein
MSGRNRKAIEDCESQVIRAEPLVRWDTVSFERSHAEALVKASNPALGSKKLLSPSASPWLVTVGCGWVVLSGIDSGLIAGPID